jgi:hypothetical protein
MLKKILLLSVATFSFAHAMEAPSINRGNEEFSQERILPHATVTQFTQGYVAMMEHHQGVVNSSAEKDFAIVGLLAEKEKLVKVIEEITGIIEPVLEEIKEEATEEVAIGSNARLAGNIQAIVRVIQGAREVAQEDKYLYMSLAQIMTSLIDESSANKRAVCSIHSTQAMEFEDMSTADVIGKLSAERKAANEAARSAAGQMDQGFWGKQADEVITILGDRLKTAEEAARSAAGETDEGFWGKSAAEVIKILSIRQQATERVTGQISIENRDLQRQIAEKDEELLRLRGQQEQVPVDA